MPKFIDLTGKTFGRWTVLRRGEDTAYKHPRFYVRCECGAEKLITGMVLRTGQSKSCGCYNKDVHREVCLARNTTHGMSRTRTHRIWASLGNRKKYKTQPPVAERWRTFENFLADMGQCPTDKHTLDRIDNAKGYEPGNCRWATMKEQQNNRTNNRLITFRGETLTLMQWSERTGLSAHTIGHRLGKLGWPVSDALTLPVSTRPRAVRVENLSVIPAD